MIRVVIDSALRLPASLPAPFLTDLKKELTFFPAKGRPECMVVKTPDGLTLPRGAVKILEILASGHGLHLDFKPNVINDPAAKIRPIGEFGLRPYQVEAVEAAVRRVQGHIVVPCGGGKTRIGAAIMAHLGQAAVVVVPTTDLLSQWADEVRAVCGIEPLLVGGGNKYVRPPKVGEVLIGVANTLASTPEALSTAGVVLFDEGHRLGGVEWGKICLMARARRKIALTATPNRSDGRDYLIPMLTGPKLFEIPAHELVKLGHLYQPHVYFLPYNVELDDSYYSHTVVCPSEDCDGASTVAPGSFDELKEVTCSKCGTTFAMGDTARRGSIDYSRAETAICDSDAFISTASTLAAEAVRDGRKVLMLVARVEAARRQVEILEGLKIAAAVLDGATPNREEIIAAFQAGKVQCLVATKLADEGLNIPQIDYLILGQGGKSKGRSQQRLGRCARPMGPAPIAVDLVPTALRWQQKTRSAAYTEAYGPGTVIGTITLDAALKLTKAKPEGGLFGSP